MNLNWCEVCGEYVHVDMYECPITGVVWWLCEDCSKLWDLESNQDSEMMECER